MKLKLQFKAGVFSIGFLALAGIANAEIMSCRSFAEAAANEWATGSIRPMAPAEMASPGEVTIISYGKKFAVPRRAQGSQAIITGGLGNLAKQRTEVYYEELSRCQYRNRLSVRIYSRLPLAD
jgi:hypothetical protein